MFGNLKVSFNSPQCGWMSIGLSDERSEFNTTTADEPYSSALSELLATLVMLVRLENFDHTLKWNRNPEEYDFKFGKNGDSASLEVIEYAGSVRENGSRVFEHIGNPLQMAEAFCETFQQLYEERNVDEFEENWHHSFPFEEFSNLEKAVRKQS
ncbi:MAG: hypothetical protein ACK5NT_05155 [Pyrinomonadaceae bacterium]